MLMLEIMAEEIYIWMERKDIPTVVFCICGVAGILEKYDGLVWVFLGICTVGKLEQCDCELLYFFV